jgi:beta-galactosidase
LTETAHDYELKPLEETVVNIDYMQSGIGSHSCGPELDEKYRLNPGAYEYSFKFTPMFLNDICPYEMAK